MLQTSRADHYDWRNSHRVRLHRLTNARRGHGDVLLELSEDEDTSGDLAIKTVDLVDLNAKLMDIGLASICQCNHNDGTCDEMANELELARKIHPAEAARYKCTFHVDGLSRRRRHTEEVRSCMSVLNTDILHTCTGR